jgi:hypothetical protein
MMLTRRDHRSRLRAVDLRPAHCHDLSWSFVLVKRACLGVSRAGRRKSGRGRVQQHYVLPERQELMMAVLVILRAKGNSQDLLARYDATLADAIATAPARPEAHFALPLGTGS